MIFIASEGLLRIMLEVPSKIIKRHPEELLIGILLKSEMSSKDFFASNI